MIKVIKHFTKLKRAISVVHKTVSIINTDNDFVYKTSSIKTGVHIQKGISVAYTREHSVQKAP